MVGQAAIGEAVVGRVVTVTVMEEGTRTNYEFWRNNWRRKRGDLRKKQGNEERAKRR
jgi:hypothetical protein